MSLLVIGGTGTLGRQIVRKALNEGFQVKCLVRSFRRASFLREWGADLIYGDLIVPETIPLAIYNVTAIIDCSTARTNDFYNVNLIDLKSKYILIDAASKAKIKRYVFFSIFNSNVHKNIHLIMLKLLVEKRLKKSGMNYTIFNLGGFFQGLIPQYAIPILDQNSIWITKESSHISYISTQDVAKITIKTLSILQFSNNILPLVGVKSWTSLEVIKLCEKICGRRAQITQVPIILLKLIQNLIKFFQWTWSIAERLAFINILSSGYEVNTSMKEMLYITKMHHNELESLELYLQEYFERIMKKLKELNFQSLNYDTTIDQKDF
uniref:NmrA-like domain-containing protein n=1 Tax=Kuetzingia canaliculata TaxID=228262 RepID=A0A1Z1MQ33_KUECA|nr:hypothetical protein [Kuetzingia canaliculata]ARW67854.1 hypothetical protein [Kuetzingia canaliculata]